MRSPCAELQRSLLPSEPVCIFLLWYSCGSLKSRRISVLECLAWLQEQLWAELSYPTTAAAAGTAGLALSSDVRGRRSVLWNRTGVSGIVPESLLREAWEEKFPEQLGSDSPGAVAVRGEPALPKDDSGLALRNKSLVYLLMDRS